MNKSQDNENKAIIDLLDYLYWSGGIDLMLFRGQSKDWDLLPKIATFPNIRKLSLLLKKNFLIISNANQFPFYLRYPIMIGTG